MKRKRKQQRNSRMNLNTLIKRFRVKGLGYEFILPYTSRPTPSTLNNLYGYKKICCCMF
jgi:hypothetical protein